MANIARAAVMMSLFCAGLVQGMDYGRWYENRQLVMTPEKIVARLVEKVGEIIRERELSRGSNNYPVHASKEVKLKPGLNKKLSAYLDFRDGMVRNEFTKTSTKSASTKTKKKIKKHKIAAPKSNAGGFTHEQKKKFDDLLREHANPHGDKKHVENNINDLLARIAHQE